MNCTYLRLGSENIHEENIVVYMKVFGNLHVVMFIQFCFKESCHWILRSNDFLKSWVELFSLWAFVYLGFKIHTLMNKFHSSYVLESFFWELNTRLELSYSSFSEYIAQPSFTLRCMKLVPVKFSMKLEAFSWDENNFFSETGLCCIGSIVYSVICIDISASHSAYQFVKWSGVEFYLLP